MWQEQAKTMIKWFEDLSLTPYPCPGGYPTIGYGHLIKNTEMERFKTGINRNEAESILDNDIAMADQALNRLIRIKLNDNQRAALVSFIFNLGAGAFQASTLRQKLNRGEYQEAADQLPRWVYGGGRILPGLVRRRHAERSLFLKRCLLQDRPEEANRNQPPILFWKKAA